MYLPSKPPDELIVSETTMKPDFNIVSADRKYPVLKVNASLLCSSIRKSLETDINATSYKIKDFSDDICKLISEYLYGKTINITPTNFKKLLDIAFELGITPLVEDCMYLYLAATKINTCLKAILTKPMDSLYTFVATFFSLGKDLPHFIDLKPGIIEKIISQPVLGLHSGSELIDWLIKYQEHQHQTNNLPLESTNYLFKYASLASIGNIKDREIFRLKNLQRAQQMKNTELKFLQLPSADEPDFKKVLGNIISYNIMLYID